MSGMTAVVNLVPDLLIPRIPASQFGPIEKHLDPGRTQGLANALSCLRVLRGVAQGYCVRNPAQGAQPSSTMSSTPYASQMVADAQGLGNWTRLGNWFGRYRAGRIVSARVFSVAATALVSSSPWLEHRYSPRPPSRRKHRD